MNETELLRQEIASLRAELKTIKDMIRERDLEERAALLQIVAAIERRWKLEPRRPRSAVEIRIPAEV